MQFITVNVKGVKTIEVIKDQSVLDILPLICLKDKLPPLGAIVNNRLVGLDYRFGIDCDLEVVTFLSKEGAAIYRRTASNILMQALKTVAPGATVRIGQSLSSGYYYDFYWKKPINAKMLSKISAEMRKIIKEDRKYAKKIISSEEAMNCFRKEGLSDKVKFLSHLRVAEIPVVTCGDFTDIFFSTLAFSTGAIETFKLFIKKPGFVLGFPSKENPKSVAPLKKQPNLLNVYLEAHKWHKILGVENVGDLNELCISGKITEMVKIAEGLHEKKIAQIADEITKRKKNVKFIFISGPSASGKTTFAKRLGIQLQVNGIFPKSLSIDNYYIDHEKVKKDEHGMADFESINAIDTALFNRQIKDVLKGKEIQVPTFSFHTGKRLKEKTTNLFLDKNEVLIVEGIHGLNDKLTQHISPKNRYKIYVSALTQLSIDNNNRIFTSDTRLIRRIVRDKLFRSYSAADTINRWLSVRSGEDRNIFPYEEKADVFFNSALIYEHAVLKDFAERFLLDVTQEQKEFVEANRLLEFLSIFVPIPTREVPNTSILREFIGGSTFNY